MQMFREQGFGEKAIISSDTLTNGESLALLRKSAVSRPHCLICLHKPDSGTGRPATASACAVCRCKTIFALVIPNRY